MAKRGPKLGSKWKWYYIKRVRDKKYYLGRSRNTHKFGNRSDAITFRLKPGYSTLCALRRHYRSRERSARAFTPPETFVLEVQGSPKAKINYPWPMPL